MLIAAIKTENSVLNGIYDKGRTIICGVNDFSFFPRRGKALL